MKERERGREKRRKGGVKKRRGGGRKSVLLITPTLGYIHSLYYIRIIFTL